MPTAVTTMLITNKTMINTTVSFTARPTPAEAASAFDARRNGRSVGIKPGTTSALILIEMTTSTVWSAW